MRIGVSVRSAYPVDDVRVGARWMIERAAAARDAGLASLFVGDHHATGIPYYQNSAILGRMLGEWGDAPAGALYLLPLWHPVLLAEQVGTLASIASGRFVLQCAVGGGRAQFGAFGLAERTRPARFEAALDIIRRLLAGEEVTTTSGPYRVEGVRIGPRPAEPLEVWIGGHAPPAIDRAARLGDGWLAGPEVDFDTACALLTQYHERCEVHGRTPSAVAIRRDIHVGADDDDAERVAGPVLERGYRGFGRGVVVSGGPDTVAAEFARFRDAGFTDVIVRHLADDQEEVLASFARLPSVQTNLRQ